MWHLSLLGRASEHLLRVGGLETEFENKLKVEWGPKESVRTGKGKIECGV